VRGHPARAPRAGLWYGGGLRVRLLVERGARRDIRDILFDGTPIEAYLAARE